jgi:uracil-DNA glycosylase family 4
MADGFFTVDSNGPKSRAAFGGMLPKCGRCGLYKTCNTPKISTIGRGKRGILFALGSPSDEVDKGRNFYATQEGQFLNKIVSAYGLDLKEDCWVTYAVICHANLRKIKDEIDCCRPTIRKTIEDLKPSAIIPLGEAAIRSVILELWAGELDDFEKWIGWAIPSQKWNAWVCPSYSASSIATAERVINNPRPDKLSPLLFRRHMTTCFKRAGTRPWKIVPNYKNDIQIVTPNEAAKIIRSELKRKPMQDTAFDYETNMLKPDAVNSQIWSCSVCFGGRETIAYPWHGEAIAATREYIRSPCGKIASNLKFETRWTMQKLRTRVRNWVWDTMIAAHVIHPEHYVTSVKFQAFVLLGVPLWNTEVDAYLKAVEVGCYSENRIQQAPRDALLLYNGLDSLLEYLVASVQQTVFKNVEHRITI